MRACRDGGACANATSLAQREIGRREISAASSDPAFWLQREMTDVLSRVTEVVSNQRLLVAGRQSASKGRFPACSAGAARTGQACMASMTQPNFPLTKASTRSTTASIGISVVSMWIAPGARARGDAVRVLSDRSRA